MLELEAQAELHDARVVGAVEQERLRAAAIAAKANDCTRTGRRGATANGVKLSVVEHVEVLPAELEGVAFLESKALEQAEVEIHTAREGQNVAPEVPISEANGSGEGIGVVVENAKDSCVSGALDSSDCVRVGDDIGE